MQNLKKVIFFSFISFLAMYSAQAHAKAPASLQTLYEKGQSIGRDFNIYEDAEKTMTIEKLLGSDAVQWREGDTQVLNFSFSTSAYWIRISVQNSLDHAVTYVFHADMPLHDYFDFFVIEKDKVMQHLRTGDRLPFDTRPFPQRSFAFPVDFGPGQVKKIILRLDTWDGLYDAIPIYVMPKDDFLLAAGNENLVYGFYYGAIIALLLYNSLVFLSTRQSMFFYYSCYLLAFALWNTIFKGYGAQYFWQDSPIFNNQAVAVLSVAIYMTLMLFVRNYLETKKNAPRIHKCFSLLIWLSVATLIPCVMGYYALSFALIIPLGLMTVILVAVAAVYLVFKGLRVAFFFLIAWGFLILGAFIYYFRVLGIFQSNFITENILNIASFIEFVFLAFALADKINVLSEEKLAAEKMALESQRELNTELDRMVEQRTLALETANEKLKDLSITDELTGLHNRRYLGQVAQKEVRRARRDKKIIAFSIMDVDHFKRYNDRYGHQKGDTVLVSVGRLLRSEMRRTSDYSFRLGGEEFGLMFRADTMAEAKTFAERIRVKLLELKILHKENQPQVVTASFGVYALVPEVQDGLEQMYASADEALYEAKNRGRNTVVLYQKTSTA